MLRFALLTCIALTTFVVVDDADAWPFRRRRRSYTYSAPTNYGFSGSAQQVAEQKVALLAARGYGFHPGGSFGGCNAEGWGMGATPGAAQANACYYGARPMAASAQAQSANGTWFSINLYW